MQFKNRLSIVIAISATLLLLVAVLFAAQAGVAPLDVQAQTGSTAPTDLPRTITVVGQGKVNVKPDVAQTTIGVEVVKPSVDAASSEAQAVMDAVLSTLGQYVDVDQDVQTSAFSIWVERPYGPDNLPGEEAFYHVSNQVSVTIRDLDKVGEILDAAIKAGANNIYGVNFSVADPTNLEADAREIAITDARAKAEALATLSQVKLGPVVSVSEVVGGNSPAPMFDSAVGLGGGGGPIAPGEQQMKLQLQVVYAIE
ncbi:MAG: SIMPL domain-containing protein [Anaerolineae bacterium]|nr:SIMPL domain-containing protein [Anaerolineae bacterium]